MTLKGAINELHELRNAEDMPIYYKPIITEIINTLTNDAIEVAEPIIRCKDCVYAKPFNKIWQLPIEDALVCTNFGNEKVDENFFCGCAIK